MKKIILAVLLSMGSLTPIYADTSLDVPGLGSLNLSNFIKNTGAVDTYDNHGVNRAGLTTRLLWYPNDPALADPAYNAWMGLEGIISWDTATGKPSGFGPWIGFRADTLAAKLLGHAPKIGYTQVPSVEFGPFGMYLPNNPAKQRWVFGGAIAKHF